jgi:polysaccharide deacetylase 2 family uncharacterized protein YibQ
MNVLRAILIAALFIALPSHAGSATPRIAIIIDDLGYKKQAGERAINLPGPIAFAILPDTPRATYLAEFAHEGGKEVLLHLPLQAAHDQEREEPGSLVLDMSREAFGRAFVDKVDSIPHAIGVNSHRGSLLTRHPGHMTWLMEEILQYGDLFFIDSYTTASSVALSVAVESGVPAIKRDVFLDPDTSPGTVEREFARLKKLARQHGFAVGIGHPHATTLEFLEKALPTLQNDGYDLISISEMIAMQSAPVETSPALSAE